MFKVQELKPAYTFDEAAKALGVSKRLIYKLVQSKELKAIKIISDMRIRGSDLADYINSREIVNSDEK